MVKRAVVTGGAGFIGSHLAEALARRNYQVIILDDLSTGKMGNIQALLSMSPGSSLACSSTRSEESQPGVEFVRGSVMDLPLLQRLFRGAEYVFHQAALPSVPLSVDDPLASHEVNVTGTLKVLLAARDSSVKKVVYASSCAVYGDTLAVLKKEDMLPGPQSPYAVAKLAGEHYCLVFQAIYGLATVCLRYFNVYGPRQDPDSQYAAVISRFITRLSQGQSPIIYGDGEQTRDFVFVKDVVEANVLAAESGACGVFNTASGKCISVNELARLLCDIMVRDCIPIHGGPIPGDIRHSLADVSRAETFGYCPRYSLEEGLKQTIRSFQHGI